MSQAHHSTRKRLVSQNALVSQGNKRECAPAHLFSGFFNSFDDVLQASAQVMDFFLQGH